MMNLLLITTWFYKDFLYLNIRFSKNKPFHIKLQLLYSKNEAKV